MVQVPSSIGLLRRLLLPQISRCCRLRGGFPVPLSGLCIRPTGQSGLSSTADPNPSGRWAVCRGMFEAEKVL